jgi:hypothetical protein
LANKPASIAETKGKLGPRRNVLNVMLILRHWIQEASKQKLEVEGGEEWITRFADEHYTSYQRMQRRPWNGRQIRNSFQTAVALAEYDAYDQAMGPAPLQENVPMLRWRHFVSVSRATLQFEEYLKDTRGWNEEALAHKQGLRASSTPATRLGESQQQYQPYTIDPTLPQINPREALNRLESLDPFRPYEISGAITSNTDPFAHTGGTLERKPTLTSMSAFTHIPPSIGGTYATPLEPPRWISAPQNYQQYSPSPQQPNYVTNQNVAPEYGAQLAVQQQTSGIATALPQAAYPPYTQQGLGQTPASMFNTTPAHSVGSTQGVGPTLNPYGTAGQPQGGIPNPNSELGASPPPHPPVAGGGQVFGQQQQQGVSMPNSGTPQPNPQAQPTYLTSTLTSSQSYGQPGQAQIQQQYYQPQQAPLGIQGQVQGQAAVGAPAP